MVLIGKRSRLGTAPPGNAVGTADIALCADATALRVRDAARTLAADAFRDLE